MTHLLKIYGVILKQKEKRRVQREDEKVLER
jgi:hypothetical protein